MKLLINKGGIQLYESARHYKIGYTVEAKKDCVSVGVITSAGHKLLKKLEFASNSGAKIYIKRLETLTTQQFREEIQS